MASCESLSTVVVFTVDHFHRDGGVLDNCEFRCVCVCVFFKEGKTCKSKCYTYNVLGVLFLEDFSLVSFMYR